ncbi:MAG: transposase [Lentisphaerae bacterium]|nr:transposase [Lentisphaerota bacterium]
MPLSMPGGVAMNYNTIFTWIGKKLHIDKRIKRTAILYVLFLMVSVRKHSLREAAVFSSSSVSRFSKFLKNHSDLAVVKLSELSKKQAKQFGKHIEFLAKGALPWQISILIDATLQNRSSLHTGNSKRFNHSKGFVVGHQWTNIVLFFNDILIPLPPIAFYTRKYCRKHNLDYKTEHENVVEYLENLQLEDYVGRHDPKKVVVLGDSGYDNKKIENTIERKEWIYIIALKKKRSVKTEKEYTNTTKSKGWNQVAKLFKNHRRVKWVTVFLPKNSPIKKRMEFRIRQITGYLRDVGKAQLICSEFKKKANGRRKYLASNDLKATPRQILLAYRIRWEIEIFHKMVKMFMGFEDVATKSFRSVISHVHWVYCAYILLHSHPPGVPAQIKSVSDKQKFVEKAVNGKKISHILQMLTRINGVEDLKAELRQALERPLMPQSLI